MCPIASLNVKDAAGNPVNGVTIYIKDQSSGFVTLTNAKTSASGVVTFTKSDFIKDITSGMDLVADVEDAAYEYDFSKDPVRTATSGTNTKSTTTTGTGHPQYLDVTATGSASGVFTVYVKAK